MSEDTANVSMPDGIEVDEAAAYFGVFESSDTLHQMMEMSRENAFEKFFSLLSDLVLSPGDFDFELASQRLSCEGGEIYFLVAGHLGIMSLPEQLALAISEGQFSDSDSTKLQDLADPMRLLKLFAIAQQTGGEGEAVKYLKGVESLMSNPAANKDALLSLAKEVQAAFDVAGHVTPITSLASSSAAASEVETAYVPPAPVVEQSIPKSVTKEAEPESISESLPTTEESVPLPAVEESVPLPEIEESVPLPTEEAIPLPSIDEPVVELDVRKESEKTEDAFAGAFGMVEEEPEVVTPEVEPEEVLEPEIESEVAEPEPQVEPEDELGEAFAAADLDSSGGLSIEEVAQATGLGLDEAAKLHAEADVDGDGQVTLEELKSKPEVIEKMALPKPVKPIRAGIQKTQAANPAQQQQQQQQQQQAWAQQQQQQQQQQAWAQQQQGIGQQAQPMQPTIRSGLTCRGCRIGVDLNWRFCPICGTQNR